MSESGVEVGIIDGIPHHHLDTSEKREKSPLSPKSFPTKCGLVEANRSSKFRLEISPKLLPEDSSLQGLPIVGTDQRKLMDPVPEGGKGTLS